MKRIWNLILMNCVFCSAFDPSVQGADERPNATSPSAVSNVAVIYWQAFSRMPNLTDQQRKAIEEASASVSIPVSAEVAIIISQYQGALHELQRAQVVALCDWQLDSDQGPMTLLPHLDKARQLSRASLLRARQRFAVGENDTAVSDVLSVYRLGRDCGASPIVISLLVDGATEKQASEVLAVNLPMLSKAQLDHLETSLHKLPKASDITSAIREEERSFTSWLTQMVDAEDAKLSDPKAGRKLIEALNSNTGIELDATLNLNPNDADGKRAIESLESLSVADVRESINRLKADYRELAKIAEMPFDTRTDRVKLFYDSLSEAGKFKSHEDALHYFSVTSLSGTQKVLNVEEQWDIRRQLFEQTIHMQRDGVAVKPINGRIVEYKKTDTGFELKCPSNGDPIVIKVGR